MSTSRTATGVILVVGLGVGLLAAARAAKPLDRSREAPGPATPVAPATPVVIELFTSQGCSSCPPADRLLSQLGTGGADLGGARVIPLAFHVDYWNYIGWTDPFSSPRWSARQQSYARQAFHTSQIYTPQLVVNGSSECSGGQRELVRQRIRAALAAAPEAALSLTTSPPAPDGSLRVKVAARLRQPVADAGNLELWLAVTEDGLETPVRAGENAALTLHNDHVVRSLQKLGSLGGAQAETSLQATVNPDRAWRRDNLSLVAFLQDRRSLAIQGAAVARLAQPEGPAPASLP